MMKGVIPGLNPIVIQADKIYKKDLPFGINEVSDEEFNECAKIVANEIVEKYVNGDFKPEVPSENCCETELNDCCSQEIDSSTNCCK